MINWVGCPGNGFLSYSVHHSGPTENGEETHRGGYMNTHSRILGDFQDARPGTFCKCHRPQGASSALC